MKERRKYKGKVIEAQSFELRDGLGWDATCSVEENDAASITITPFFLTGVFPTRDAAIQAAFQVGQQKIDSGFEHKSVVESRQ